MDSTNQIKYNFRSLKAFIWDSSRLEFEAARCVCLKYLENNPFPTMTSPIYTLFFQKCKTSAILERFFNKEFLWNLSHIQFCVWLCCIPITFKSFTACPIKMKHKGKEWFFEVITKHLSLYCLWPHHADISLFPKVL